MAKTLETIINRFDGGIVNDARLRIDGCSQICRNFDVFTNRHRMTPYRDSEDGNTNGSTDKIANFTIGYDGSNFNLYGLGVQDGTGIAEIFKKALDTGAGSNLDDNAWDSPSNHQSSAGATSFNLFTYYAKTGLIYGAKSGTNIWAFDPTGSASFEETANSLTYTEIGDGLVHSKDDILYIPYYNSANGTSAIAKFNGSTWTNTAITFPTYLKPTSICEYGNFIAVAMSPVNSVGKSFVYLWNRDDSLSTLTESIEWGSGVIKVLEEIEGVLVGISLYGGDVKRFRDRIIFRYYTGATPKTFLELQGDDSGSIFSNVYGGKQKVDERLYFAMRWYRDGSVQSGLWSLRVHEGRFALAQERTPNNDTELNSANGAIEGFIKIGDYTFIAYQTGGSYAVSKTNDQSSYTASSIWQSNINPNMSASLQSQKKQLVAISASYEPLPTAGSVKLEYRVDGGSWVEIFTETTDSEILTEAKHDVNGDSFQEGREYEFKVTSTGGAEITEIKYKVEEMATTI